MSGEIPPGELPLRLDGRVALVTGGATGIGFAIARQLAGAGASVVIASRDAGRLEAAAAEISATGGDAHTHPVDVRDAEQVERLVDWIVERLGRIDVAVNNAGGQFLAPILQMSAKGWGAVIDLNLNGTFNVLQSAGRRMVEQRGGCVVNIVTAAALRPTPGRAHSGAARSAVMSLTRSAALEWAPHGVRVNAVAPGPVHTEALVSEVGAQRGEAILEHLAGLVPLGRLGTPQEIAWAVHFLVSDAAAFLSGEVLAVDGGGWQGEGLTKSPGA